MRENQSKQNAFAVFDSMCDGILFSFNAGDVYIHHLLARIEKREVDSAFIENLLLGNRISGQFAFREHFSESTFQAIRPHIETLANQLIVATHSALEIYLQNKFEEFLIHKLQTNERELLLTLIENLNLQSLERIKDAYKKMLGIYLACYEIDRLFVTDNPSLDSRKTSWKRIQILSEARNEIVHAGNSRRTLGEIYPSDSWNLFDFSRRWVHSFDANFNMRIYEDRKPSLIQEYEERVREKLSKNLKRT